MNDKKFRIAFCFDIDKKNYWHIVSEKKLVSDSITLIVIPTAVAKKIHTPIT